MKAPLLISLCGVALVAGCASSPQLNYQEYAGEPIKSFYMPSLDGWAPASKTQAVLYTRVNEAYLVTVNGYCPDLRFVNAIGVTSTADTVDKFEKLLVGHERCFIKEIRPIDTKAMREDRKALAEQMKRPVS